MKLSQLALGTVNRNALFYYKDYAITRFTLTGERERDIKGDYFDASSRFIYAPLRQFEVPVYYVEQKSLRWC